MKHFCTLFDSNYLTRGLALYDSLANVGEDFKLYILCFDEHAFNLLKKINLERAVPITLEEFETDALRSVKKERSRREYCWTCSSHIIRYVIDKYGVDEVTYLDSDLFFFSKPSILLEELDKTGNSVIITDHRFSKRYKKNLIYGRYCVQFMTFKADENGLKVLQWWQDRCLEWCYFRLEDGKFGDQKYLDNWARDFKGILDLENIGAGVAPWNVQNYKVTEGPLVNGQPIIFYHFHNIYWQPDDTFNLGTYKLAREVKDLIYSPYIKNLKKQLKLVQSIENDFNKGKVLFPDKLRTIRYVYWHLRGIYNVIKR